MIKLVGFSGAMFAAGLLLCAFAVASQDKDAPSNVGKTPPSNVVLEDHFEKLQADFLKTKQELEQKLDAINRRLDSMDREQKLDTTNRTLDNIDRLILSTRGGTVDESSVLPPDSSTLPALSDGRSDYSDLQPCCRRIKYHVPCCRYVYNHEQCCRDAYHRVRHVYHPRRIYHPQPCWRYAYRELD